MRRYVIALAALAIALPATAQETREAFNKRRFGGWSGLAFYCSIRPEDDMNKRLCEWAKQRIRFLAKPLNITTMITVADPSTRFTQKAEENKSDLLDVELQLLSTKGGQNSQLGFYMALRAIAIYNGAVETVFPEGPERQPRPGTLVLWERDGVALGVRTSEFDIQIHQSLEIFFLEFLSDFADGR